jgi:hypothetical protein
MRLQFTHRNETRNKTHTTHFKEIQMKIAFNTTTLFDKVAAVTLAAIAITTVSALFGAAKPAVAQEAIVQPMEVVKMDTVVVTAPRIHTVKLDTIVVTAQR